jgi:hypothetical protein
MVAATFRLRNLVFAIELRSQADPSAGSGQALAPSEKWHFSTASEGCGYQSFFTLR